jgi:cation diffusion facilitator family transporter
MEDLNDIDDEPVSPEAESAAQRSTWVSVAVNIMLAVAQAVAGWITQSQGLIADSIHSLSDLASDAVVLLALRHSRKDADEDHHYGHQRYENAASLVLGLLLFVVGAGMVWSAVGKVSAPQGAALIGPAALWVALGSLLAKELLFRYMLAVAQRVRSRLLVANAWHARSDAASSLVVAVGIGGNLMGLPLFDPIAAAIVGFMVGKTGWTFLWEALHDLTDRAATTEETERIRQEILGTPGILGVHDLRTRRTGDLLLVDAHLEVDGSLTVEEGHRIAVDARRRVMERHPVLNMMTHVDPRQV